jgi:hypothetical protein
VTELKNLPVSQEDMQIFMHKTGQA